MKRLVIIFLCLNGVLGYAQKKEDHFTEIKTVVSEILTLSHKKNIEEINRKYIDKEFGIYDVHRIGVPDLFDVLVEIPKRENEPSIYTSLTAVINANQKLQPGKVAYDCDKETWKKKGLFYSKAASDSLLTKIVQHQSKYENRSYSAEELKKIAFIEKNSVKIIDTASDLVFYLTKIRGKWYLTLIDRVTMDCSV